MTDKKNLILEIKDYLEKIENRIDLSITEAKARDLLETCYILLK